MKNVEELVIRVSREERRSHLDLSMPCIFRGGSSPAFRGLLATMLDTTIPQSKEVFLCHACHNGGCSNWKHLYWGTRKDNGQDYRESPVWKTGWQKMLDRHGESQARTLMSKASASKATYSGGTPYSAERLCEILDVVTAVEKRWGWKKKCADQLGISHTQLRRFLAKHLQM